MISYVQLKPCVNFFFSNLFKRFEVEKMVVEPKMAQLIKPNEEPINLISSTSWKVQKPSISSKILVWLVKIRPHLVEYRSRGS